MFFPGLMDVGRPTRIRKLPFEEGGRRGTRGNEMTSALARDQDQISPKDIRFLRVQLSTITFRWLGGSAGLLIDRFLRSRLARG